MLDFHEIVVFLVLWGLVYLLSSVFMVPEFTFTGKSLTVQNKFLKAFCAFPLSFVKKSRTKKSQEGDENKVSMAGCIFYALTFLTLVVGIVLQFVPAIPCQRVAIEFDSVRYRAFSFVADTYNQKIPFLSVWILLFSQLLFMVIYCIFLGRIKKDRQETIGIKKLLLFILVALLAIAALVYCFFLLFQDLLK